MSLNWDWAGNDAVAKGNDLVFRLHEKYIIVKEKHSYREEEFQTYQLQIKKQDHISFKDLGYVFYMHEFRGTFIKSVDRKYWKNIHDVVDRTEEILEVLGFI